MQAKARDGFSSCRCCAVQRDVWLGRLRLCFFRVVCRSLRSGPSHSQRTVPHFSAPPQPRLSLTGSDRCTIPVLFDRVSNAKCTHHTRTLPQHPVCPCRAPFFENQTLHSAVQLVSIATLAQIRRSRKRQLCFDLICLPPLSRCDPVVDLFHLLPRTNSHVRFSLHHCTHNTID